MGMCGRSGVPGTAGMTGHYSFQILRDRMDADLKRRAETQEFKRAYDVIVALTELRQKDRPARSQVAEGAVTGANEAPREHDFDICLSELGRCVALLGGRLELIAVFPKRRIRLGVPPAAPE